MRTSEGGVILQVPQVREAPETYRSRLMARLRGNSEVLERLAAEMYVRGLSTRDIEDAIAEATGEGAGAPGLMMAHELALSELYVEARLEAEKYGWTLAWHNARLLELEKLGVQPDAWLRVSSATAQQEAYLEVTAAMPAAVELSGKLEGYRALWERSGRSCAVLWLAHSQPHAARILKAVRRSEYGDCFLVGLLAEAHGYLTRRMWRWGNAPPTARGDVVQWLQPPTNVGGLGEGR